MASTSTMSDLLKSNRRDAATRSRVAEANERAVDAGLEGGLSAVMARAAQDPPTIPAAVVAVQETTPKAVPVTARVKSPGSATVRPLSIRLDNAQHARVKAYADDRNGFLDQVLAEAMDRFGDVAVEQLLVEPDVTRYRKGVAARTMVFQLRPDTRAVFDGYMGRLPGVSRARFVARVLDLLIAPAKK